MWKFVLATSSVWLALGLLLGACAPAATPTPPRAAAPAATPAPTPTVAPAPGPATPLVAPTPKVVAPTPMPAAPAPPAARPVEEKPRYGGILTSLNMTDLPPWDFIKYSPSTKAQHPTGGAYNLLITPSPFDPDKIQGDLAQSWEMSPDGMVYTFHLRKGVMWHDGQPFTSADVKATFDRHVGKVEGVYPVQGGLLTSVERVEAPDDYTVKFFLKHPYLGLLDMLSQASLLVYPKHIMDAKGGMEKDVLGTGPFKFKEWLTGVSVELVRNADYWYKGRPYLDGVIFYFVLDAGAQKAAVTTGRIKLLLANNHSMTPADVRFLQKQVPGIQVQQIFMEHAGVLYFNSTKKPYSDVRVRRAIHLATDRPAAIQVVKQGFGQLAGFNGEPFRLPEEELLKLPGYRQPKDEDMAQAKRLMTEAGYPQGFSTKIMSRNDREQTAIAIFMANEMAKLGIKAKVEPVEGAAQKDRLFRGAYETSAHRTTVLEHPDLLYSLNIITGASRRYPHGYSNPEVDRLFYEQLRTLDTHKRTALLRELERIALWDAPMLSIYQLGDYGILGPQVRGYRQAANIRVPPQSWQEIWLAE